MRDSKDETRNLWRHCFSDSEDFVELYFRRRFTEDRNQALWIGDRLIASLQRIPYTMTLFGCEIPISYVSGVCTHPDFRNQGYMPCLLAEAHRQMARENALISTLIPAEEWLKGYYNRYGYAVTFFYAEFGVEWIAAQPNSQIIIVDLTMQENMDEIYDYFNERMFRRSACLQHTKEDFYVIIDDLRLSKGKLLVAKEEEHIVGLAFCYPQGGVTQVQELLFDSDNVRISLLYEANRVFALPELTCYKQSLNNEISLGMARILQVEKILRLFAARYPDQCKYIELIRDEAIPENNGFYTVENGTCVRKKLLRHHYKALTVAELTFDLLQPEHPYMSLMLN